MKHKTERCMHNTVGIDKLEIRRCMHGVVDVKNYRHIFLIRRINKQDSVGILIVWKVLPKDIRDYLHGSLETLSGMEHITLEIKRNWNRIEF